MREQQLVLPFGSLSMRNFLLSVAAIFVAIFAYIFIFIPDANAQAANAEWNGNSITYNQHQYIAVGDSAGLPDGTKYIYAEPVAGPGIPTRKAHVIYFSPGTDPPTATSANFVTYDFTPPGTYTNPSGATTIAMTPQSASSNPGTTSCDSTFTMGIGWIVCPITNFLASAMDWLFDILSGFLAVRPVQTSQETALYRAWSFSRNFANVAFVIGFLVIIYSQLTSMGISNYNLKKMLPRLVLAAILMNISYWICAVAIDISNILGYSIQDIFIAMRNGLVGTEGNGWNVVSWKSIGGFILSGGTAAVGLGIAGHALLAGTVGGALYLLLPILVAVIMAVLIALLVMAARQAIITILVILSPLAFVAYLLPNTEKYFDKWRDLFTTMLIMFPLFSIIFGGSQLAGIVIIQNADSINLIILGMAVQVAPVVITPLLVKFSGSLLGRIAGMINNPNKGIVDRTRNWSKERAEQHKARAFANLTQRDKDGLPKRRRDGLARVAQSIDRSDRKRKGWLKANQDMADAGWANTSDHSDIQQRAMQAAQMKEVGDTAAAIRYEVSKRTDASLQQLDINARASKLKLDVSKAHVEANWNEIKAGDARSIVTPAGLAGGGLARYIRDRDAQVNDVRGDTLDAAIEGRRTHSAQHVQSHQFAEQLEASAPLRARAGGIDPNGAIKAEAAAMETIATAADQEVAAGIKLLNFKALKANTTLKSFSARIVSETMAGAGTYSAGEVEAALDAQAQDGQVVVLEEARMSRNIDQKVLSQVLSRNAGTMKTKGGFHLQADPSLAHTSLADMNKARAASLGDTPASNMKDLKFGWIKEVATNIHTIIPTANPTDLQKAYDNVLEALQNDQIRATIGDRLTEVQAIELALRNQGYRAKPPTL